MLCFAAPTWALSLLACFVAATWLPEGLLACFAAATWPVAALLACFDAVCECAPTKPLGSLEGLGVAVFDLRNDVRLRDHSCNVRSKCVTLGGEAME